MATRTEAQREAHNARRRVTPQPKLCEVCGETFTPKRSDAKTCSDRCRQRLSRMPDAVAEQNAAMRESAKAEIAAGSTCPIPSLTANNISDDPSIAPRLAAPLAASLVTELPKSPPRGYVNRVDIGASLAV